MNREKLIKQLIDEGMTPSDLKDTFNDFRVAYDKEQVRLNKIRKQKEQVQQNRKVLLDSLTDYLTALAPEDKNTPNVIKEFEQELKDLEAVSGSHAKISFKVNNNGKKKEFEKEGDLKIVNEAFEKWFDDILRAGGL